jgi:hypothetical protein
MFCEYVGAVSSMPQPVGGDPGAVLGVVDGEGVGPDGALAVLLAVDRGAVDVLVA